MNLQGLDARVLDKSTPKPAHALDNDGTQHDADGRDCSVELAELVR